MSILPRASTTKRASWALAGAAGLASALVASSAPAQSVVNDVNLALPNVLLLVDTSGSMEYNIDGTKVQCNQRDASLTSEPAPVATSQKNRWTQLVEVLTGNVTGYQCYAQDRSSDAFRDEFKLGPSNAPDYQYRVPYHRILSGTSVLNYCTVGPGTASANAFDWDPNAFRKHLWNSAPTLCPGVPPGPGVVQDTSGLLDAYKSTIRFGLMTFDNDTDPGTGLTGTTTADYPSGTNGAWSYFPSWQTSAAAASKGHPPACTDTSLEVGARNGAAPPWEGRLIPFGSPEATLAQVGTTNDHIKQALLAVRPSGATPLAGLMADAKEFLLNDTTIDRVAGSTCDSTSGLGCFGPKYDEFVSGGCRKNYIVLLSDGAPNLDLRPWCEAVGGSCPYGSKPEEIAFQLAHPASGDPILTAVVGFAVSSVDVGNPTLVDCTTISVTNPDGTVTFDPNNLCGATMKPQMSACCTLAKIAYYGGTANAQFVTDQFHLRSALSDIFGNITKGTTARTAPTFSGAGVPGLGFQFLSSFHTATGKLWQGVLERVRYDCSGSPPQFDATQGDDFAANVNSGVGPARNFYTWMPTPDTGGLASRSVRPFIPTGAPAGPDGAGTFGALTAQTKGVDSVFAPAMTPEAFNIIDTTCTNPVMLKGPCTTTLAKWVVGMTNGTFPSRNGDEFADIFHSTPVIVGPPNETLRDESYTAFTFQAGVSTRPIMLYTSTNDGVLHAFQVTQSKKAGDPITVTTKSNNELWALFPPAVLPRIQSEYPSTHMPLLDGAPVVKDVVYNRTAADSQNGTVAGGWHTVLVSGFGSGGTGYYAVDITKPVIDTGDPPCAPAAAGAPCGSGPHLLWQLTTDAAGNRLFGKSSGRPVITTLFFDPVPGGTNPQEYAVAILPGGMSDGPTGVGQTRLGLTPGKLVDTTYPPRSKVHSWAADPARSLTIVMLKTGEIIRTFRRLADGPASILGRAVDTGGAYAVLDSPISGQPVTYPADTGAVADRAFVGDADGTMWRVNLAATDPRNWTMDIWFDAYATDVSADPSAVGQPIVTPPLLSLDRLGNITAAFSTGDQEQFTFNSTITNYVWSLTEDATNVTPFRSKANWFKQLGQSTRVSGPMSIFSSYLYFTTFSPADPSAGLKCATGTSNLWSMHYLTRTALGAGPVSGGGLAQQAAPFLGAQSVAIAGTSFGAGIVQRPTCTSPGVSSTDPYLGYGSHTDYSSVTPGAFQLVVQTGKSGAGVSGTQTNTQAYDLPRPPNSSRIDSWGAILDYQ